MKVEQKIFEIVLEKLLNSIDFDIEIYLDDEFAPGGNLYETDIDLRVHYITQLANKLTQTIINATY